MKFLKLLILSVTISFIAGCQTSSDKKIEKERFVRISFDSAIRSLDPRVGVDYPSAFATRMLFEGLLIFGPDGKVQPGIAKSYDISEDLTTYTFHLRKAYWSNGEEITAHDFEYAWKGIIDPKKNCLGAQNFYPIKNVQAIILGELPVESAGIKVLDANTLQVQLEQPTPYFLEVVAMPSFFPVSAAWDEQHPGWSNTDGEHFVCNGPYTLKRHHIENELVMKKNSTYWDADHVTMPGIQISIIKNPSTQLGLFEKGRLDWLGKPFSKIPLDAMTSLKKRDQISFIQTLGLYWYFINTESFPFNNKKIRQAFAYAINRDLIAKYILQGNEPPATGILPYHLSTQKKPFFKDNDREHAAQLFNEGLQELGIEKAELPEITLSHIALPVHLRVAEAIQQQWNETFGIHVRLEHQEWKTQYEKLQKGNFQIGGTFYQSWLRDPIYLMQIFKNKSVGANMSHWENKHYQELLSHADAEGVDPLKRRALFNKAEAFLMEEMPVIPICFAKIAYAKNSRLKNVCVSDLYEGDFRWSYFEEAQ